MAARLHALGSHPRDGPSRAHSSRPPLAANARAIPSARCVTDMRGRSRDPSSPPPTGGECRRDYMVEDALRPVGSSPASFGSVASLLSPLSSPSAPSGECSRDYMTQKDAGSNPAAPVRRGVAQPGRASACPASPRRQLAARSVRFLARANACETPSRSGRGFESRPRSSR